VVDGMKPGEINWDTKLIGFGLQYQRRDKVFVYKCRIRNRQRWFAIGKTIRVHLQLFHQSQRSHF
jgi:hypothetical protein